VSTQRGSGRDPLVGVAAVLGAMALAGMLAIGLAWRSVDATTNVALQIPDLVSGGIGGLALVLTALALVSVQADRRARARERADTDDLLAELASVVATVRVPKAAR